MALANGFQSPDLSLIPPFWKPLISIQGPLFLKKIYEKCFKINCGTFVDSMTRRHKVDLSCNYSKKNELEWNNELQSM